VLSNWDFGFTLYPGSAYLQSRIDDKAKQIPYLLDNSSNPSMDAHVNGTPSKLLPEMWKAFAELAPDEAALMLGMAGQHMASTG
jgi:hypothetical protein